MSDEPRKGPDPQRAAIFLAAVLAWKDERDRLAEVQAKTETLAVTVTPETQGITAEAAA